MRPRKRDPPSLSLSSWRGVVASAAYVYTMLLYRIPSGPRLQRRSILGTLAACVGRARHGGGCCRPGVAGARGRRAGPAEGTTRAQGRTHTTHTRRHQCTGTRHEKYNPIIDDTRGARVREPHTAELARLTGLEWWGTASSPPILHRESAKGAC